jgi:hypothetical protein
MSRRWMVMVPMLLGAAALAAIYLNSDLYWLDEELSLYRSRAAHYGPATIPRIVEGVSEGAAWPPLYYFLLAFMGALTGWSEVATRHLSLLIGVLALAMTYRMAADLFNKTTGLLAALMLASSAFYLHYLHEARGYTLYVLVTAFTVWMYWRTVTVCNSPRNRALLAVGLSAMLYTHYIAAMSCAALGLYHLLFVRRERVFRAFIYAGLSYIPWTLMIVQAVLTESGLDRDIGPVRAVEAMLDGFSNGMAVFLLALLGYAGVALRGRRIGFVWFWLIVALILSLLANEVTHYLFHIRHVMVLLLPLVLIMAAAIVHLKWRWMRAAIIAIWVVAGLYQHFSPAFMTRQPGQLASIPMASFQQIEQVLDESVRDEDLVVFYTTHSQEWLNERVLVYYLHDYNFDFAQLGIMGNLQDFDRPFRLLQQDLYGDYETRLRDMMDGASAVWLFILDDDPPVEQFQQVVTGVYAHCDQIISSGDLQAYVYTAEGIAQQCRI